MDLRTILSELLQRAPEDLLVDHLVAVMKHLFDSKELSRVADFKPIARKAKLIPRKFKLCDNEEESRAENQKVNENLQALSEKLGLKEDGDPWLAKLCFSAAIYPQKIFQLKDSLLPRLQAFLEVAKKLDHNSWSYQEVRRVAFVNMSAAGRLASKGEEPPIHWTDAESERFLSTWYQGDTAPSRAATARILIYLCSCNKEMLHRMQEVWCQDEAYVRQFIKFGVSLPDRSIFREVPALEKTYQDACQVSKSWPEVMRDKPEILDEVWHQVYEKLTSDLTYYQFRSPFRLWWKEHMRRERIEHTKYLTEQQIEAIQECDSNRHKFQRQETCTSEEDLRRFREGYRLSRMAIFSQDPLAVPHDRLRQAIDSIYFARLKHALCDEDTAIQKELLEKASQKFKIDTTSLKTVYKRFRDRFNVYIFARMFDRSDREIDFLFDKVSGWRSIIGVARSTPADCSLAPAFFSHILLRAIVDNKKNHKEEWGPEELSREVDFWLTDTLLEKALEYGQQQGRRVDMVLLEQMSKLRELCKKQEVGELYRHLCELTKTLCRHDLHRSCFEALFCHQEYQARFRQLLPVIWCLRACEDMSEKRIMTQLHAKKFSKEIGIFADTMKACQTTDVSNERNSPPMQPL